MLCPCIQPFKSHVAIHLQKQHDTRYNVHRSRGKLQWPSPRQTSRGPLPLSSSTSCTHGLRAATCRWTNCCQHARHHNISRVCQEGIDLAQQSNRSARTISCHESMPVRFSQNLSLLKKVKVSCLVMGLQHTVPYVCGIEGGRDALSHQLPERVPCRRR